MYTKLIHCGDIIEVTEYEREPTLIPTCRTKRARFIQPIGFSSLQRIKRTRKAFIRFTRCAIHELGAPAFATFTLADLASLKRAKAGYSRFCERMQGVYPRFRHITVHEWQRRGAVHFHALVWGIPKTHVKKERARRRIQNIWRLGYVDIVDTNGSPKISSYMAKYMLKAMHDPRNYRSRAYSSSARMPRPQTFNSRKNPVAIDFIMERVDKQVDKVGQFSYYSKWLGKTNLITYKNNYGG